MAEYYLDSAVSTVWAAGAVLGLGVRKVPTRVYATAAAKLYVYEVTTAGTAHATTEPAWVATVGSTTADNTIVYTCREAITRANSSCFEDYIINNAPAGDNTIYMVPGHTENIVAENVLYIPATNTPATPFKVICATTAATPPTTVAETAVVNVTGSGSVSFRRSAYRYGITYNLGSGSATNQFSSYTSGEYFQLVFEKCATVMAGTSSSSDFFFGPATSKYCDIKFIEHRFKLGDTFQEMRIGGNIVVIGGSVDATGAIPTALVLATSDSPGAIKFVGTDIASTGTWTGKALVDVSGTQRLDAFFYDCKIAASAAITAGTYSGPSGSRVKVVNSTTDTTMFRYFDECYMGKVVDEKTIVRTGGGTQGSVPVSFKMTSTNSSWAYPLELELFVTNETTGVAKTLTVEIVHDSTTALTDGDIGLDVMVRNTASVASTTLIRDLKASILAVAANQETSTAGWTTTGLTNPNKQKMSVTFTPQVKGIMTVKIRLNKPSKTVYVCNEVAVA